VVVTGYVDDLAAEIGRSELFVAPMISGGGFKNKVAEALQSGTFVASTGMGVEFLPVNMQKLMIVADQPGELADRILEFLAMPQNYQRQLEELQQLIASEFTWRARAEEFLQVVESQLPH
jgi:glycosyltransferase involved in cell wall biosynthesis